MGSWWYRRRGGAWERTRSSRLWAWSPDGTSVFSPPSPRERLSRSPARRRPRLRGHAARQQQILLLLDDTFTTGARLQSAASALQLAGARMAGAVVVDRFVNPEYCALLLKRARARPYDFGRCCLEVEGG
jgi:hypothetical protein